MAAFNPVTFFSALGLVPRPLFGEVGRRERGMAAAAGRDLIFLDGVAASFALALQERPTDADDSSFYDWAWSSNVSSHIEVATDGDGLVLVRRWDAPGRLRRFTLRSVEGYGADFLRELEKSGPPRAPTAVGRALYLFQVIRDLTSDATGVTAIRIFHSLLRKASRVALLSTEEKARWLGSTVLGEALPAGEREGIPERTLDTKLYNVHTHFLASDPTTGRSLQADLLLRHAAGALYQEAHLDIERQRLLQLPLLVPEAPMPVSRREVVFTPPGLARVLVERATKALSDGTGVPRELRVLDPACGSGVFLVETLLSDINLGGAPVRRLRLTGYDISEAAATMASLAVSDAASELPEGMAHFAVEHLDALEVDWPEVDIVLMNPPFVSWQALTDGQRDAVLRICGKEQGGRPDLAMAFVTKALSALRCGGVLATVLPSSLLSTQSGQAWRTSLAEIADVLVVGRFQGSDIFPTALVEPSILVLRKKVDRELGGEPAVFLLSRPGAGDAALRALRTASSRALEAERFDLYEVPQSELARGSWLPRPFRLRRVARSLERHAATRVRDVFQVHQGIRTGANTAFVLDKDQLAALPKSERRFFRPLAGNKTIRRGQLNDQEYVFFPYHADGLSITTEAELRRFIPTYFRTILYPAKDELLQRARVEEDRWWRLSEPRAWQFERQPKLVSSYFGGSGKFAVDESGDYVVGQGYGWLFASQAGGKKRAQQGRVFEAWRDAAWCYLALFNSQTFETLLSYYSYHVMGGQLDLSPRFVNQVPLPDFVNEPGASQELASGLRHYGRLISSGKFDVVGQPEFEELAAQAFGATAADFAISDER